MSKNERFVGLGLAMVDEKIHRSGLHLPSSRELVPFLDTQSGAVREAGGVTPNIISSLTAYAPLNSANLLACTGNDIRGEFYRARTPNSLGTLQTAPEHPTGVVVSVINDEGVVYDRGRNLGAAEKVRVPKEDLEDAKTLFLTDLTTIRLPGVFEQSDRILASLGRGNFFLNLAGLNPAIAPREQLLSVLTALRRSPDIVTGNESEFTYLVDTKPDNVVQSALQTFPDTRLLILTLANNGSVVRFEDEMFEVPPCPVPHNKVVDETGAGDTFAGIMLGALYTQPYSAWTRQHVQESCQTAAFGASLAVQTIRTRLTNDEMQRTRNYARTRGRSSEN